MKRLFFVRHGESLMSLIDVFASKPGTKNDLSLTTLGKNQALEAGKKLADDKTKIDLIICSPCKRTVETAEIIASQIDYPKNKIIINELFVEIQFGELEGKTYSPWNEVHSYKDLSGVAGAEDIEKLQKRADKAWRDVSERPDENILIVSHSAFGRAFKRVIEGRPWTDEEVNHKFIPYCEVLKLI